MTRLMRSKKYEMFIAHDLNRDVQRTKLLEASMRRYGYDDASPIRCIRNGPDGRLKITAGHHRFHVARKLGIEVYYNVASKDIPLFESEGTVRQWSVQDFTDARSRAGDVGATAVLEYKEKTGLPISTSIALVSGQSAGAGGVARKMKEGTFAIGSQRHAKTIERIVLHLKSLSIRMATNSCFINAVSRAIWVPEFDVDVFLYKISCHSELLERQRGLDAYMELIELIYNRNTPTRNRLGVKFFAEQTARARMINGMNRGKKPKK